MAVTSRHNKYTSIPDWFSGQSTETATTSSSVSQTVYISGSSSSTTTDSTVDFKDIPIDASTIVWQNELLTVPIDNDKIIIVDGKVTTSLNSDGVWELRLLADGTNYIYTTYPVVTQLGITMYSGTEGLDIGGIYDGLPIDNNTIYWDIDSDGNRVLKAIGSSGGGVADSVAWSNIEGKPSWLLDDKISYSEIEGTPDLSKYALVSQIPSLEGYALSSDLAKYIPISGYTDITGEKNFTGGLKVNGSPIYYDTEKKYWKLEGDLLVTGGVTMYGNDSDFVPSTITDAILYDDSTLGINTQGQLYVKGSVGGATTLGGLSNVDSSVDDYLSHGLLFNQNGTWIQADNTTIRSYLGIVNTIGGLTNVGSWADSVAPQDRIMYQAANSSQWVAKNLSDLAVGGVTGNYLPLTGGTLSGTSTYPLVVNTTDVQSGIQFLSNNDLLGVIINGGDYGTALINFKGKYRVLGIDNDGNAYTTIDYSNTKATLLHTYNYSSYALPLSGGTLTGTLAVINEGVSLCLYRQQNNATPYIRFAKNTTTQYGELGVYNDGRLVFWPLVSSQGGYGQWNTVWHSGNDGSGSGLDADLLDGYDSSYIMKYGGNWTASTDTAGIFAFGFGGSSAGLANNYGAGIQLCNAQGVNVKPSLSNNNANWYSQLLFGTDNRVYARFNTNGSGWSGQNKIAYVTDNVASATKLQTARTIWGQSFNGTGDIGNKSGSDASSIHIVDNRNDGVGGYQAIRFYYNTDNQATIHYFHNNFNGLAWTSKNINIEADYITLGTWNNPTMIINRGNGNVGIGTTSPDAKLHIVGDVNVAKPSTVHQASLSFMNTSSDLWQISGRFNKNNSAENDRLNFYYYNGTTWSNIMTLYRNGNMLVSGGITMYSARKLKNITDERGLSLDELSVIKPTRFTWKDGRDNKIHIGGIADDVMKVLPEVIYKTGEDDTLTMDYGNAAFAIAASLIKPVISHEERIKVLEEENKKLKEEVEQLKWNIA